MNCSVAIMQLMRIFIIASYCNYAAKIGSHIYFLLTSKFFNISIYPAKGLYIYNPRCRAGAKV